MSLLNPQSIPLDSINTLHTLKGLYPDNTVCQCLSLLGEQDVLILIESGVNNLLNPEFITLLSNKPVRCYVVGDDALARNIEHPTITAITYNTWVDLSAHSQRIINWF